MAQLNSSTINLHSCNTLVDTKFSLSRFKLSDKDLAVVVGGGKWYNDAWNGTSYVIKYLWKDFAHPFNTIFGDVKDIKSKPWASIGKTTLDAGIFIAENVIIGAGLAKIGQIAGRAGSSLYKTIAAVKNIFKWGDIGGITGFKANPFRYTCKLFWGIFQNPN